MSWGTFCVSTTDTVYTYSIYMIRISIPKYSFVLYYLYSMYAQIQTDKIELTMYKIMFSFHSIMQSTQGINR